MCCIYLFTYVTMVTPKVLKMKERSYDLIPSVIYNQEMRNIHKTKWGDSMMRNMPTHPLTCLSVHTQTHPHTSKPTHPHLSCLGVHLWGASWWVHPFNPSLHGRVAMSPWRSPAEKEFVCRVRLAGLHTERAGYPLKVFYCVITIWYSTSHVYNNLPEVCWLLSQVLLHLPLVKGTWYSGLARLSCHETAHRQTSLNVHIHGVCVHHGRYVENGICGEHFLSVGVDLRGPADEFTLIDENSPFEGLLASLSVWPLTGIRKKDSV